MRVINLTAELTLANVLLGLDAGERFYWKLGTHLCVMVECERLMNNPLNDNCSLSRI